MRVLALLVPCLALASPAAAQTTFAHLSALDAAVFSTPPKDRLVVNAPYDAFSRMGRMRFAPIAESYTSPNILERFQEVRRYGGRLTVPVTLFGTEFVLEGEGARDYGPAAKQLDIGRARLTKEFSSGLSTGIEVGAYNLNPKDPWLPHKHLDRDYVAGAHVTLQW